MSGRKIFISYKYADDGVQDLGGGARGNSTVRDYVDLLEGYLASTGHIYKGESDGEDLSRYSDECIWRKLRDRIYDSSLTIVVVSPGMVEPGRPERDQWIPWEVSYSLKETSRRDANGRSVTSRTNAMVALVLPDREGNYGYYLERRSCCATSCTTHHTDRLFKIIRENKFNRRPPDTRTCRQTGEEVWSGDASYIKAVRWRDFVKDPERHIEEAYARRDDVESYELHKEVE